MILGVLNRLKRRLTKLRLQPIRVFCFHQVSDVYNPLMTWKSDWSQTEIFKQRILALKKQYTFISLQEAHYRYKHDIFRRKKYAVLTSDDGMQCLSTIIPWLESENIPITMFLSAKYLDGISYYKGYEPYWKDQGKSIPALSQNELYLSHEQVWAMLSPLVEIAIHGWEHIDVSTLSQLEFEIQTQQAINVLKSHPRFIPFYAYAYGRVSKVAECYLHQQQLIPVLCDGRVNSLYDGRIHRECIDGEMKLKA